MRKKVLEVIKMNHPKATNIIMRESKVGKRYFFAVDAENNETNITEEFTYICRMFALDELVRRINEGELV